MIKSKHILIAAAFAVAMFNTACSSTSCCAKKKDIGLQLYSLRADIKQDYCGTIKKIAEMGYTEIEAAGYKDGKFYDKTPEEFKKSIEKAGLKVVSSHTRKPLTKEELASGDFSESMKFWDKAIDAHKAAGMKYMAMSSMPKAKTLKDLDVCCKYLNEIGKRAAAKGLKFGYHNHAYEFEKVENKDVMIEYMLKNTNPNYVFFELDVYWTVIGKRSPVELFEQYPNRFELLHIKDLKELGASGMVGFDAIFKNRCKAGAKHIVVEVERYNFTPLESVKKSFDYLNNAEFVK